MPPKNPCKFITQKHKRLSWILSPKHQSSGTVSQFHIFLTKSISIIVDVKMSPFSILAWMASVPHTFYLYVQHTLTLSVKSVQLLSSGMAGSSGSRTFATSRKYQKHHVHALLHRCCHFAPTLFRLLYLLGIQKRLPFTFWNSSLLL